GGREAGAGMEGTALEVLAELRPGRGGPVDEGGARRAHAARVADRAARPLLVPARLCRPDIVLPARREAEADNVDEQILAFAPNGRRQPWRLERRDLVRQDLGDGGFWKRTVHGSGVAQAGFAKAGDAIDRDDDREGDGEHDQA